MNEDNEIDKKKRGKRFYRPLNATPFATGERAQRMFERWMASNDIPFAPGDFAYHADGGDGKRDYLLGLYLLDVKGTTYPVRISELLVEAGKVTCDIYVLISLKSCVCVGFAWREEVLAKQPGYVPGTVLNHVVPAKELHPMGELKNILGKKAEKPY
jgi:hypothetical protein